jgi:Flp pilus assembly protein TadD
VDITKLAPLSGREQALIVGADGAAAQGNEAAAERDYMAAIAASTGRVEAHLALARLYMKQAQPDKARAILEHALALQPNHPLANYMVGKMDLANDQYEAAREKFRHGLTAQPTNMDLIVGMGVANDMLGQHHAAQQDYLRAMKANPTANLSAVRSNLAMSYILGGAPKKAVDLLQNDIKQPHVARVTRHNLALAYGMLNRHAEAKKLLVGDMDEATRTLTLARMKEYLAGKTTIKDIAPLAAPAKPAK